MRHYPNFTYFALFLFLVVSIVSVVQAETIYVDITATGAATGSNWTDAFTDLQSALEAADDAGDEIWISVGIPVIPDTDSGSFRTAVPVLSGQRFQFIPDTPSGGQHG